MGFVIMVEFSNKRFLLPAEKIKPFIDDSTLQIEGAESSNNSRPQHETSNVKQLYSQYIGQSLEDSPLLKGDVNKNFKSLEEEITSLQALAKELEEAYQEVVNHRLQLKK